MAINVEVVKEYEPIVATGRRDCEFLDLLIKEISKAASRLKIEERPTLSKLTEDMVVADFKSYVGVLPLPSGRLIEIRPDEEKVNPGELRRMLAELNELARLSGQLMSYAAFSTRVAYSVTGGFNMLAFSEAAIELAMRLLSSAPVITEERVIYSPAPLGIVDPVATEKVRYKGLFASIRRRVSVYYPPVLALAECLLEAQRFLREARFGMPRDARELPELLDFLEERLEALISAPIIQEALKRTSEISHEDVLRAYFTPGNYEWREAIDLWFALKSRRPFRAISSRSFLRLASLKPLSKVYELWVLRLVCQRLGLDGLEPWKNDAFRTESHGYAFFYNSTFGEIASVLGAKGDISREFLKLRPDMVILARDKRKAVIIDAKYRKLEGEGLPHDIRRQMVEYAAVLSAMGHDEVLAYPTFISGENVAEEIFLRMRGASLRIRPLIVRPDNEKEALVILEALEDT